MFKSRFLQLFIGLIVIIVGFSAWQLPHMPDDTVDTWTEEAEILQTEESGEDIREQIEKAQEELDEPPVDAVIDDVWKGIPGYNGRLIDVRASYENMQEQGHYAEELLVFQDVSPEVEYEDLPPTPFYKANPNKPMVGFVINVAWGNEHLPDILNELNEQEVRATFFLDGSWVRNQPRLARMIKEEGHEIGNHAYSHPDMAALSPEEIRSELEDTNEIIDATLNEQPEWFTPPSGSFNQEVVEIAHELDMYTVLWTVDTIDWKNPDTNAMVDRVVNNIHPGAMILMHPTQPTAEGIGDIIEQIREQGLEIGTISSAMDENRVAPSQTTEDNEDEGEGDKFWYNEEN
ncbi:putative sporulation protein (polysaccharide deacetylase family) [Geomicrobium halophilum]|uniref:Putative sporulation protein (Polysaccharide deacetylase family) n=1 Tax=Geomicrobium halophilum TaxID=549000 RepID=A0A841PSI6_9BACL|nr:polysaccharide deacetylase family protein [Geomicrobium halophilum]MBB6449261.1 putative sporulation protein (polysaccharide deacetylase family) [Geomicrobium halophilum]